MAEDPYNKCKKDFNISDSYLGPIKDAAFSNKFDLVFTNTVLIHVNPDDLLKSMEKMYEFSSKYILICEYFNRTPVMIEYRGELDMLFKRDFGKLFIENFDCEIVDNASGYITAPVFKYKTKAEAATFIIFNSLHELKDFLKDKKYLLYMVIVSIKSQMVGTADNGMYTIIPNRPLFGTPEIRYTFRGHILK